MMDANKGDQTTEHAANGVGMSNGNGSTPEFHENIIIGGGPGGVNLGMEFAIRGIPYVLLERSSQFGGQFHSFPRCGELISLNKKHIPPNNPGWMYARRYDWHTLSTITEKDGKEDPKLVFTNWSDCLFPRAKTFAEYVDYVGHHQKWRVAENTRFNSEVVHITSDDSKRFVVEVAGGKTFLAQRLFIGSGTSCPVVPNIIGIKENATFYADFNPDDLEPYRNKRCIVLGGGNSAFEVAHLLNTVASDLFILINSVVRYARQTHNVHDIRSQTSVSYDLSQLKSLTTIGCERIVEVTPKNGRLLCKTRSPQPHWTTPVWLKREFMTDHIIVACGFEYNLPDVFTGSRVKPETEPSGKFCALKPDWESVNVPNMYFVGGSMRVNDRDAASGFIHGFRYNIQALGSLIAESHYNTPLVPLFQCVIDPKSDDTFEPLCKFIISMVSSAAALFELFSYACSIITFQEVPREDDTTTPTYKAEVWDTFPIDYARPRWSCKKKYVGRVEIIFQYGFNLYGDDIPTSYFTHPTDRLHPELSAYIHPALHAYRHDNEDVGKFPESPGKIDEWHLEETLPARWDKTPYMDERRNRDQYINIVYNAAAAALGVSNRKNTLPFDEELIDQMFPPMTEEELLETYQREPGMRCIVEGRRQVLESMAKTDMKCHMQTNGCQTTAQMEKKTDTTCHMQTNGCQMTTELEKKTPTVTKMPSDLSGKVAVVTGSSRGIGAGCAIRLAEHGAHVVINYNSQAKPAEEVAEKCRNLGVKAIVVQADVTKQSEVEKLFNTAKKEFGRIDIVMSNSGIIHWGAPDQFKSEEFDKVFGVNVKAQFLVAQQAFIHLEDKGRLILMSSITAQRGVPNHALYASSKAAIQGMTRSLAYDFGPRQITVNCVAPGGIKTDMYFENANKYLPGDKNRTIEQIDAILSEWSPLGRPGFVEDVAGVVALLSSPEAQWITGQSIQVSGGACMT